MDIDPHARTAPGNGPGFSDLNPLDLETTVVARAWHDEVFRLSLLTDPKGTIERETGLRLPEDLRISVHQETPMHRHLVIPVLPSMED